EVLNQMTFSGFLQNGHSGILPSGASLKMTFSMFSIFTTSTIATFRFLARRLPNWVLWTKEKRPDTTPASQRELSAIQRLHTQNTALHRNNNASIAGFWIPACHQ